LSLNENVTPYIHQFAFNSKDSRVEAGLGTNIWDRGLKAVVNTGPLFSKQHAKHHAPDP
jgi:hypothetical protein